MHYTKGMENVSIVCDKVDQ